MFGAAGFFVHGIATTGTVFLLGVPLIALWGIANASSLGLMSRRVGADEQGQLQGANASIQGIANMIGPGLFTLSFAYAIRPELGIQMPGTPFAARVVAGAGRDGDRVARDAVTSAVHPRDPRRAK